MGKDIYGVGTVFIMLISIILYLAICVLGAENFIQIGIPPKQFVSLNTKVGILSGMFALVAARLLVYLLPIFKPNFNLKRDGYENYYNDIHGWKKICIRILELITTIFMGFVVGSMVGCLVFIGKALAT